MKLGKQIAMTTYKETSEEQLKLDYAGYLIREPDPLAAAILLFPHDMRNALKASKEWPQDEIVLKQKAKLLAASGDVSGAGLPSKDALALDIWQKMQGKGVQEAPTIDEYVKLAKLYADVQGFIDKPSERPTINNNIILPRAIEVPVYDSDEAWEAEAERQQRQLLESSRGRK
jgi:hypothetical protein